MPTVDLLLGIAEFSIGLAGFSAIIAVFAGRDGRWAASDRQRGVVLILTALTPGFISFVALGLGTIDLREQIIWRLSGAVFAAAIVASLFIGVTGYRAIPDAERQVFSPVVGTFLVGGSALNGAVQLFGAFGGLGSLTFTGLYFGLVWQLFVGAIQFVRIVFVRPDHTGGV
jgi:hypothetical protein